METKELKIQVPDGYEIDRENSTFECIKFKLAKKYITYKDVCNKLFKNFQGYLISGYGQIDDFSYESDKFEPNSATNRKQLDRLLALNQLLNITEYYNRQHVKFDKCYTILYYNKKYKTAEVSPFYSFGLKPIFNRMEDVQEVIDNPNFEEILDMVYKDC